MGLFGLIKDVINLNKEIKNDRKAHDRYVSMSDEEVFVLDDKAFYNAVYERIGEQADKANSFDTLNKYQLAYFLDFEFDADAYEGGLCQFLYNTTAEKAENIAYCLKLMSFNEIAELFNSFVDDNNFDFSMLDDEELDFEELSEEYDFDSFDNKFYELYNDKPMHDTLLKFARENYRLLT